MTDRQPVAMLGLALLVLAVPLSAQGSELRVCLLDDDLPRAHRELERGFDLELMAAVAERIGRRLVPVWVPSAPPFSEIDDTELPIDVLVRGACDAAPSIPGLEALGDAAGRITLSRPYYGAAFELVSGPGVTGAIESLQQLRGETVVVQLQTLGHLVAQQLGLSWLARPTGEEALAALRSRQADYALMWGPTLARLGERADEAWQPPTILRFNEHVAVSRRERSLGSEIDAALLELDGDGTLQQLAQRYGLHRRPFDGVYSRAEWLASLPSGRRFALPSRNQ